jgi:hypothetical protein
MNLIDAIRLWKFWEKLKKINKRGVLMNDWKTTTLGILTIIAGLANAGMEYLQGKAINIPSVTAAILAGWGLIHAKDSSSPNAQNAPGSTNTIGGK